MAVLEAAAHRDALHAVLLAKVDRVRLRDVEELRDDRRDAAERQVGDGFGGRQDGWVRKVEVDDPNPPPCANTLRAPGQSAVSIQAYILGLAPEARSAEADDEASVDKELARAEADLLASLQRAAAERRLSPAEANLLASLQRAADNTD